MILQHQWFARAVRCVRGLADVGRGALNLNLVQNEDAVVKQCNECRSLQLAGSREPRGAEHHIVGLPLSWGQRGIHQRNVLLVNARCLSV